MRLGAIASALLLLAACDETAPGGAERPRERARVSTALAATPTASTVRQEASSGGKALRLVPFDGGVAAIEQKFLGEHIQLTREDRAAVDSWCAGPIATYDKISEFFALVQERVAADDRSGVTALVKFPLRVNAWRLRELASAEELAQHWERVFSARAKRKIASANPAEVFCRDGTTTMFGAGVLWAEATGDELRLRAVND